MHAFLDFLYRLIFGLAVGMALTPTRPVPSGFFRVHTYVLLGLAAAAVSIAVGFQFSWQPAVIAAVVSYAACLFWWIEKPVFGKCLLVATGMSAVYGLWHVLPVRSGDVTVWWGWWLLDALTSGLLLGAALSSMFLGHWYLNTPSMEIEPLRRLLRLMFAGLFLRTLVAGFGLDQFLGVTASVEGLAGAFLILRWSAGLLGTGVAGILAWKTLDIPNTQSATGILYVCVITTFLGELAAVLLSRETGIPL